MCSLCLKTPCDSRCPNAPEPKPVVNCKECGVGIFEGERFYDSDKGPICEDCMRYSKERIEEMIAKAEGGEDGVTNNAASSIEKGNVAKGEEETMIDKSLLTPAELAFFEDIEKRCSVAPGEVEKADTKGKATEEEEEEDEGGKGKKPGVKKSASPQEDIYAGLHPIVAA